MRLRFAPILAVLLVALLAAIATQPAGAQSSKPPAKAAKPAPDLPAVKDAQTCGSLAELATHARAMKLEGIAAPKALKVLGHVYLALQPSHPQHAEMLALVTAVIRTAYRTEKESAGEFAMRLLSHCLEREGDLSGILGRGV